MRGPLGTVIPFQHNPIHPFRGSEKKVEFLALVWVSAVAGRTKPLHILPDNVTTTLRQPL